MSQPSVPVVPERVTGQNALRRLFAASPSPAALEQYQAEVDAATEEMKERHERGEMSQEEFDAAVGTASFKSLLGLAGLHMDEEAFERSMNETLQQSKTPEGRAAIEARTKQLMEELEAQHEGDRTTQCQICLEPLDQTLALERQDAADYDPATSVETLCCGHKFHVVCVHRRRQTHPLHVAKCEMEAIAKRASCTKAELGAAAQKMLAANEEYAKGGTPPSAETCPTCNVWQGQITPDQLAMPVPTRATKASMPSWLGFSTKLLARQIIGWSLQQRSLSDTGSDLSVEEEIRRIDERLHSGGDEGVAALRRLDEILELAREHFREYIVGRTPVELETERLHLPSGLLARAHDAIADTMLGHFFDRKERVLWEGILRRWFRTTRILDADQVHGPVADGYQNPYTGLRVRVHGTEFDGAVGRALMQANLLTERHFHYPVLFDDGRAPLLKETNLSLVDDRHRKALEGYLKAAKTRATTLVRNTLAVAAAAAKHGDAASAEKRALGALGFAVGLPVEAREFEPFARAAKLLAELQAARPQPEDFKAAAVARAAALAVEREVLRAVELPDWTAEQVAELRVSLHKVRDSIPPAPAEARRCGPCGLSKFEKDFSANQWRKGKRRCLECQGSGATSTLEERRAQIDAAAEAEAFAAIRREEAEKEAERIQKELERRNESAPEENECTICFEMAEEGERCVLPCHSSHWLCRGCLQDLNRTVASSSTPVLCPHCRAAVPTDTLQQLLEEGAAPIAEPEPDPAPVPAPAAGRGGRGGRGRGRGRGRA